MKTRHRHAHFIACLLVFSLSCTGLSAQPLEFFEAFFGQDAFGCNSPVFDFNNGLGDWTVVDNESSDEPWSLLGECEDPGSNNTGGTGDAACTSPGYDGPSLRSAEFDTSLISPEFNLNGITSAALTFKLHLRQYRSSEKLDLQISYDGGDTWVPAPVRRWSGETAAITQNVTIDLSPYVGATETKIRFRYYDDGPTTGDFGYYAQIDDISLDCTGGADLETSYSIDPAQPVEGQSTLISYTVKNNGPVDATNILFYPRFSNDDATFEVEETILPDGLTLADLTAGRIPSIPAGETFIISFRGTFVPNSAYTLTVVTPDTASGSYDLEMRPDSPGYPSDLIGTNLGIVLVEDGVSNSNDGCEEITNGAEISGNIALAIYGLRCSSATMVQHAADAGAKAIIIFDDAPIIVGPGDGGIIEILADTEEPIPGFTIESDITDLRAATDAQGDISQNTAEQIDLSLFAIAIAEQADPDKSNNLTLLEIPFLIDTDLDGVANIAESCDLDPAKTEPLFCGCGIADTDSDNSGAIDCLTTDELAVKAAALAELVKKVRRVKLTGKKKVDKKRRKRLKALKQEIQDLLAMMEQFVTDNLSGVSITSATDLTTLQTRVARKTKLALKTNNKKFGKRKKRARKTIRKLQNSLNTTAL